MNINKVSLIFICRQILQVLYYKDTDNSLSTPILYDSFLEFNIFKENVAKKTGKKSKITRNLLQLRMYALFSEGKQIFL